jgi:hypothetical protein
MSGEWFGALPLFSFAAIRREMEMAREMEIRREKNMGREMVRS